MGNEFRVVFNALVAFLWLAGCVGGAPKAVSSNDVDPSSSQAPMTAADGRDLRYELREGDRIGAPTWQIGERFRNHVFFGTNDKEGRHFDAIVTSGNEDSWVLATDDREIAKENAIIDLPILGDIRKSDLTMSGFGQPWDVYEFPLSHKATWKMDFPNIAWDSIPTDTVPLVAEATFAADISTSEGPRPGFQITARTTDGTLIAEYDFVPAIGWFAHFTIYDIDESDDPMEFHVTSMGHDYEWTGTYYIDEAKPLLEHLAGLGVNPDEPTQPVVEPGPTATFTMSDDGQLLVGLIASIAIAGAQELAIISPSGETYHWETIGAPVGELEMRWEVPAEPGEWRLIALGAGAAALAYAELYELVETTRTL